MSDGKTEVGDSPPAGAKHARPSLLAGLREKVKYLSHGSEGDSGYNGAFSYAAEYHAPAIGFAVGFAGTPEQQKALISYALGRGGAKQHFGDDPHIRDVADEPAYALAAMAAGKAAKGAQSVPLAGLI